MSSDGHNRCAWPLILSCFLRAPSSWHLVENLSQLLDTLLWFLFNNVDYTKTAKLLKYSRLNFSHFFHCKHICEFQATRSAKKFYCSGQKPIKYIFNNRKHSSKVYKLLKLITQSICLKKTNCQGMVSSRFRIW